VGSTDLAAEAGQALLEAGRLAAAREEFWRAADAADDAIALARAALGLGGLWVDEHRSTFERARVSGLQRRALARLDRATSLAHRLRSRLAAEESYASGDTSLVLGALDEARAQDDPAVLVEALWLTHHCLLGPEHSVDRLALADEPIATYALVDGAGLPHDRPVPSR
jgi:hypothetical protein